MLSVKTIFKTLFGTIVIIVATALIVEMLNLSVTSIQLTQMSKLACKQSAVLFSQETYKQRDAMAVAGGSVNMDPVRAHNGAVYVEGNFYGEGLTAEQIYTNIYTSTAFKNWCESPAALKGHWKSIDLINQALNAPGSLTTTLPSDINAPDYDSAVDAYTDSMLALSYKNVMMTPLNMGVPYMDEEVLNRIFKWNLSQLASDCNSAVIREDQSGNICVYYKGFRVYADQARISDIEYRVYDIEDTTDLKEFKNVTHIDPAKLGYDDSLIKYLGGYENDDERKRICVIGLQYDVPVGYEGITPIKQVFNWLWNYEVEGLDGSESHDVHHQWNDATANLASGGFGEKTTPDGVLPVPGKLIYYVVR